MLLCKPAGLVVLGCLQIGVANVFGMLYTFVLALLFVAVFVGIHRSRPECLLRCMVNPNHGIGRREIGLLQHLLELQSLLRDSIIPHILLQVTIMHKLLENRSLQSLKRLLIQS